jgi:hypothetical protein
MIIPNYVNGHVQSLSASPNGVAPYTYQWYNSTNASFVPSSENIMSETSNTLLVSALVTTYYIVRATDHNATVFTSETYCVIGRNFIEDTLRSLLLPVTLTESFLLEDYEYFDHGNAVVAGNITLNSATGNVINISCTPTSGTTPYTYQWYKSTTNFEPSDDTLIADANDDNLTISNTTSTYYVMRVFDANYIVSDSGTFLVDIVPCSGSLATTGSVLSKAQYARIIGGSLTMNGTASPIVKLQPSGSLIVGGTCQPITPTAGNGSLTITGTVAPRSLFIWCGIGPLTIAGSIQPAVANNIVGSLSLNGSATTLCRLLPSSAGSLTYNGNNIPKTTFVNLVQGTTVLSGEIQPQHIFNNFTQGSLAFSGTCPGTMILVGSYLNYPMGSLSLTGSIAPIINLHCGAGGQLTANGLSVYKVNLINPISGSLIIDGSIPFSFKANTGGMLTMDSTTLIKTNFVERVGGTLNLEGWHDSTNHFNPIARGELSFGGTMFYVGLATGSYFHRTEGALSVGGTPYIHFIEFPSNPEEIANLSACESDNKLFCPEKTRCVSWIWKNGAWIPAITVCVTSPQYLD